MVLRLACRIESLWIGRPGLEVSSCSKHVAKTGCGVLAIFSKKAFALQKLVLGGS